MISVDSCSLIIHTPNIFGMIFVIYFMCIVYAALKRYLLYRAGFVEIRQSAL